jgi:hypothetical protein
MGNKNSRHKFISYHVSIYCDDQYSSMSLSCNKKDIERVMAIFESRIRYMWGVDSHDLQAYMCKFHFIAENGATTTYIHYESRRLPLEMKSLGLLAFTNAQNAILS